jgi:uncharacterized lipoprotein NlpE involved in copper resistance
MRRDAALGLTLAAVALVSGTVASLVLGQGKGEGTPRAVTYAGTIPCADCPVQRIVLTLFPDFTFRLRRAYVGVASGKDRDVYDLGRWARAQDEGDRLRLTGGAEAPLHFRFVAPDRLRMLDREGREIRSTLNYELARQPAVDPVAGPMPLRGMYSYLADAALFDECLTGKRFPVALEAAHAEVERAYREAGPAPGAPVLVTLDGRFDEREVEGPKREHVIVEALGRFWPGEKCAKEAAAVAPLLETQSRGGR